MWSILYIHIGWNLLRASKYACIQIKQSKLFTLIVWLILWNFTNIESFEKLKIHQYSNIWRKKKGKQIKHFWNLKLKQPVNSYRRCFFFSLLIYSANSSLQSKQSRWASPIKLIRWRWWKFYMDFFSVIRVNIKVTWIDVAFSITRNMIDIQQNMYWIFT